MSNWDTGVSGFRLPGRSRGFRGVCRVSGAFMLGLCRAEVFFLVFRFFGGFRFRVFGERSERWRTRPRE